MASSGPTKQGHVHQQQIPTRTKTRIGSVDVLKQSLLSSKRMPTTHNAVQQEDAK